MTLRKPLGDIREPDPVHGQINSRQTLGSILTCRNEPSKRGVPLRTESACRCTAGPSPTRSTRCSKSRSRICLGPQRTEKDRAASGNAAESSPARVGTRVVVQEAAEFARQRRARRHGRRQRQRQTSGRKRPATGAHDSLILEAQPLRHVHGQDRRHPRFEIDRLRFGRAAADGRCACRRQAVVTCWRKTPMHPS